jgi:hypothetical protein
MSLAGLQLTRLSYSYFNNFKTAVLLYIVYSVLYQGAEKITWTEEGGSNGNLEQLALLGASCNSVVLNNISDLLYMDFTHRLVFNNNNNNNNNRVRFGNCNVPRFKLRVLSRLAFSRLRIYRR